MTCRPDIRTVEPISRWSPAGGMLATNRAHRLSDETDASVGTMRDPILLRYLVSLDVAALFADDLLELTRR